MIDSGIFVIKRLIFISMESTEVREQLRAYISQASEEKVQAIFTLVKDDILPVEISDEHWALIQEARSRHYNGETTASSWEDVYGRLKARLRNGNA